MRVIVTRPEADAGALAARLRALGHDPLIAPMLAVALRKVGLGAPGGVQAILATSRNGVRGLAASIGRGAAARAWRALPVIAVGDATATEARAAGFADTVSAAGDARALAALVARRLDPDAGSLLLASGTGYGRDLARRLRARGFRLRRRVVYAVRPARCLPGPLRAMLEAMARGRRARDVGGPGGKGSGSKASGGKGATVGTRQGGAVLFFSPRAARRFATLARRAGAADALAGMAAVCLSRAVARAARATPGMRWGRVAVASRPDTPALLAALAGLAGTAPGRRDEPATSRPARGSIGRR